MKTSDTNLVYKDVKIKLSDIQAYPLIDLFLSFTFAQVLTAF